LITFFIIKNVRKNKKVKQRKKRGKNIKRIKRFLRLRLIPTLGFDMLEIAVEESQYGF
jgi:hypothetical protein